MGTKELISVYNSQVILHPGKKEGQLLACSALFDNLLSYAVKGHLPMGSTNHSGLDLFMSVINQNAPQACLQG